MTEAVSVSQLNRYVLSLLEADPELSGLYVKGEISSFKRYPSGHLYFTLKDDKASVSCVMFRGAAQGLSFEPKDGQKVLIAAKASLYERDGKFQLYVNSMRMDGQGDLYAAYEQLKSKLEAEGLFDPEHKKKIPLLPSRIGVVTSPAGAVFHDILHVLGRRFPDFSLILSPSQVQGDTAARSIVSAIEELNRRTDVDVIIVARGGGSIEDLWCFNEEIVARAVYGSKIPVISAVGHETDFTICDFAADLRAPTPSAAAELVMPIKSECIEQVRSKTEKLSKLLRNHLDYEKLKLRHLQQHRFFTRPANLYEHKRETVDSLTEMLFQNMSRDLDRKKASWNLAVHRLDGLSPLKVLGRGYAVAQDVRNRSVLRSVRQVKPGEEILVRLSDGELDCSVLTAKADVIKS